ncbi:RNA polymerase [Dysgonomonas sp. ZJ709]|uniref:RNA polymerase n=1 Tax=Dysgonomonas sp. ZJ709 TaxID=2709797 RepID=UPI0013EA09F5|nr:RNA polymerase [Dysgonomonas sp. ZJ709]
MTNENVYEQNGYKDRNDYLRSLAEDNGVDMYTVTSISELLGEGEDFDGLVLALDDFL